MKMMVLSSKEHGPVGFLHLVASKIRRLIYYGPLYVWWHVYKIRNKNCLCKKVTKNDIKNANKERLKQDNIIQAILSQKKGKTFLEIGIGSYPNIQRLKSILANETRYTGCDFQSVCEIHKGVINKQKDFDSSKIRFLSNQVGTYSWNLFEILRKKERFDLIYLDGHHTFYVDFPALVLAHLLLKPGGYLLIDDIQWTLDFMRSQLMNFFWDWVFYRKIYKFSDYNEEQQKLPHIGMMAETILMKELKYLKIDEYSLEGWWTLKKPLI